MRAVKEILNVRGRLIALCLDGTIWLYDVPDYRTTKGEPDYKTGSYKRAIENKPQWQQLPEIPS